MRSSNANCKQMSLSGRINHVVGFGVAVGNGSVPPFISYSKLKCKVRLSKWREVKCFLLANTRGNKLSARLNQHLNFHRAKNTG